MEIIRNIGKVAHRKGMNVEIEEPREKSSRDTTNTTNLKVAQDTAHRDLEMLQQVEGNHERLQQNTAVVQMQHETISGQHQDKLRPCPDTLNKPTSTPEYAETLEDQIKRLKEKSALGMKNINKVQEDKKSRQKDETISKLLRDMKQLKQQFLAQSSEAKNALRRKENDLKEALEANSALERHVQSISEQKNNLEEKILVLEEDKQDSLNELKILRAKHEEATVTHEKQKKNMATLVNTIELLIDNIKDKEQNIICFKEEIEKLNDQVKQIKNENDDIKSKLCKNVEESKTKSVTNKETQNNIEALDKYFEGINNAYKTLEITSEEKIKELSDIIEEKAEKERKLIAKIKQLLEVIARTSQAPTSPVLRISQIKEKDRDLNDLYPDFDSSMEGDTLETSEAKRGGRSEAGSSGKRGSPLGMPPHKRARCAEYNNKPSPQDCHDRM